MRTEAVHAQRRPRRVSFAIALPVVLALCAGAPEPFAQNADLNPSPAEPVPIQVQEIARFDARFDRSGFPFTSLVFSPDGRVLALLTDLGDAYTSDALLIETATGRELARPRQVVAISPDRRWLVTRSEDGTERLIETAGGTEAMLIGIGPFSARAFSPDLRVLAVTDERGTLTRLIDTATRQEVGSVAHHYAIEVYVAEVSSYGSWSTDSRDELSQVVETPNGKVLVHLSRSSRGPFWSLSWGSSALSPDGRWRVDVGRNLSTGAPIYQVTLLEVATTEWRQVTGCQSPPSPPRIAFSPDSSMLAVVDSVNFAVPECNRLIDTVTGAERARFEGAMSIAFSPNSRWLATGGMAAQLIDTASGAVLARVEHDGRVDGVAFSPDGILLATVSTAGTAPTLQSTVRLLRVNP